MKKEKSFINTIKKIYQTTDQYKIDLLIADLVRWQRKEKIANNKIRKIQKKINLLAIEFSKKELKALELKS